MVAPCGCGYSNGQCRTFLSLQRALLDSSELEQQENLGCFCVFYENLPTRLFFLLLHSCSVMCNSLRPTDCSLPGSSVHGISQARILEWGVIYFPLVLQCLGCHSSKPIPATSLPPEQREVKKPPARLGFTVTENKPDPGQGTLLVAQSLSL